MSDKTRDIVTGSIGFTVCMITSIMWYHVYVAPHGAARRAIMDCMVDNSLEAYQDCHDKLNPRK